MKREASPIVVAVGILTLLVAIEFVYWQKLGPAKPRVTAATTQGGGGSRGGSGSEAPSGDPGSTVVTLAGAPEPGYRDGLATEALNLMEQRHITSLIIKGQDGRVEGVIHLHDLWRTEMF